MLNLFLGGIHFTAMDLKIVFGIFREVPIFGGKFVFWTGEFYPQTGKRVIVFTLLANLIKKANHTR